MSIDVSYISENIGQQNTEVRIDFKKHVSLKKTHVCYTTSFKMSTSWQSLQNSVSSSHVGVSVGRTRTKINLTNFLLTNFYLNL